MRQSEEWVLYCVTLNDCVFPGWVNKTRCEMSPCSRHWSTSPAPRACVSPQTEDVCQLGVITCDYLDSIKVFAPMMWCCILVSLCFHGYSPRKKKKKFFSIIPGGSIEPFSVLCACIRLLVHSVVCVHPCCSKLKEKKKETLAVLKTNTDPDPFVMQPLCMSVGYVTHSPCCTMHT